MNKFVSFMRSAPKRVYALLAIAVATLVVPAVLHAWGPASRATFTMEKPAGYVTFNSIINNQKFGDERNFVQIRNFTDNGNFGENVELVPGKEYEVFAYFHNNAKTSLNASGAGVATGAFMRTEMPDTVPAGSSARVTSYVGATNAKHLDASGNNLGNQVWDEAYGKNSTSAAVALRYVPDSAKITSAGAVNGKTIDLNQLASAKGALLGYNALDGNLPGCSEYSGYVIYRIKVVQPNFEIAKQVSLSGQNQWGEEVTTTSGSEVEFKLKYKNTGTVQQDNVAIRDELPAGLVYVSNSTMISNSKTNNQWTALTTNGAANNTLTSNGVNVGSHAPGAATYIKFKAKVADPSKLVCGLNTITNKAFVNTENGSKEDTAVVKVNKECEEVKDIKVCELDTKNIITIKENEYDKTKHSKNLADCEEKAKPIKVCELDSKDIVTIEEKDFDSNKHSKNLEDCKEEPTTPTTPSVPTTPTTPSELPHTGISDSVLQVVGLGSLVAAGYYYLASRRIA